MLRIGSELEYFEKIKALQRPGEENYLAFYDHRLGAVFTNPRLMLIPLDDHLVHRGDGVFEMIKFVDGKIYQLDAHVERLAHSAMSIYLSLVAPKQEIKEIIRQVAAASGVDSGLIAVLAGRGPGGMSADPRECPAPSLYVVVRRFPQRPESFWDKGVSACKVSVPTKPQFQAKIKTVNYLSNVLMKMETTAKKVDFGLSFGPDGFLAEGAAENVILVNQEGKIIVPEMNYALSGTTLRRVLDLVHPEFEFSQEPIREDDIWSARELILLGTSLDALSIVRYNNKPIFDVRPGPVSKRIRELLKKDLAENGVPVSD